MGTCCQTQSDKEHALLLKTYTDYELLACPCQAQVVYEYEAVDENELTIKTGEILIVIDESEKLNGWALAIINVNDGMHGTGYVPANYVRLIADTEWRKSEQCQKAQQLVEFFKLDEKAMEYKSEYQRIAKYWCSLFQDEKNKMITFPSFIIDFIIDHVK